jgi:hypothetical protein
VFDLVHYLSCIQNDATFWKLDVLPSSSVKVEEVKDPTQLGLEFCANGELVEDQLLSAFRDCFHKANVYMCMHT